MGLRDALCLVLSASTLFFLITHLWSIGILRTCAIRNIHMLRNTLALKWKEGKWWLRVGALLVHGFKGGGAHYTAILTRLARRDSKSQ